MRCAQHAVYRGFQVKANLDRTNKQRQADKQTLAKELGGSKLVIGDLAITNFTNYNFKQHLMFQQHLEFHPTGNICLKQNKGLVSESIVGELRIKSPYVA